MSEFINFKVEDNIGFIEFNRPAKYNSFIREMALSFQDALRKSAEDEAVRCIYITGTGKAFSAGQDLVEATDPNSGIALERIVSEHYNPIILLMRSIEKPIITAINGVAAGAGANIALAGDIVVATKSASFIQAFSKIGLIPDSGGTFILPRLIGLQKASAIMMLGDKITAEEAEKMGMIYKVFPDETFAEASKKLAAHVASMPTKALGLTKKALNASVHNSLEDQLALEEKLQAEAAQSEDYAEGTRAFIEKRKPKFIGK